MCLGIPGEILEILNPSESENKGVNSSFFKKGVVRFGGVTKEINLAFVPEAKAGDYVIVHVGFAISRLDPSRADLILNTLEKMRMLK